MAKRLAILKTCHQCRGKPNRASRWLNLCMKGDNFIFHHATWIGFIWNENMEDEDPKGIADGEHIYIKYVNCDGEHIYINSTLDFHLWQTQSLFFHRHLICLRLWGSPPVLIGWGRSFPNRCSLQTQRRCFLDSSEALPAPMDCPFGLEKRY